MRAATRCLGPASGKPVIEDLSQLSKHSAPNCTKTGGASGRSLTPFLTSIDLSAPADAIQAAASLQERIVGTTEEETNGAIATVGHALVHPILHRAAATNSSARGVLLVVTSDEVDFPKLDNLPGTDRSMFHYLFGDAKYAAEGALTMRLQPLFWGADGQHFPYDERKLNEHVYWTMVRKGYLGIACEPNCVPTIKGTNLTSEGWVRGSGVNRQCEHR